MRGMLVTFWRHSRDDMESVSTQLLDLSRARETRTASLRHNAMIFTNNACISLNKLSESSDNFVENLILLNTLTQNHAVVETPFLFHIWYVIKLICTLGNVYTTLKRIVEVLISLS